MRWRCWPFVCSVREACSGALDSRRQHLPLCEQVLLENDAIFATSHFLADTDDPFWQYSDAVIHQTCFLSWDQRTAFVAAYNAQRALRDDGTYV